MAAKRVEAFYGDSGTGKSEAAARVIRLMAEATGKKARVLVGDGSRATYEYAGLIEAGIVDIMDYTARKWPLSTMQLLTEGYWPEDADDPASPLIAPSTPAKTTPNKLSEFGVYVIEGIAVGGLYIMGDQEGGLSYRSGKGEKIGQDSPIRVGDGQYVLDGTKTVFKPAFAGAGEFGANPPSHYNVAQRRILTMVDRSKMLPMEFVIWTSHQRAVEDKLSKEVVVGPEAPGGALTTGLQRIFNNTLHFDNPQKRVKIGDGKDDFTQKVVDDIASEFRIYTRDHYAATPNITYKFKAVTRGGVTEKEMPDYLTGGPGDAIEEFYMRLKKLGAGRAAELKAKFEAAQAAAKAA